MQRVPSRWPERALVGRLLLDDPLRRTTLATINTIVDEQTIEVNHEDPSVRSAGWSAVLQSNRQPRRRTRDATKDGLRSRVTRDSMYLATTKGLGDFLKN